MSDNLLWMQNPELANALRKRQEGAALMRQGMDGSPIRSPWEGVNRFAQALLGGYESRKGDEEISSYGAKNREELAAALARNAGLVSGAPQGAQIGAVLSGEAPRKAIPGQALPPAGVGDTDDDWLVRTVYGEAGGESAEGQRAVAAVIRNRARMANMPIKDVVTAPGQFEPWNNVSTRAKLEALKPDSPEYQAILANLRASQDDPTGGATHFYSPNAQAALGRPAPEWATGEGKDIGGHRFYNLPYSGPGGGQTTQVAGPGAPTGQPPTGAAAPQVQQALRLMDEGTRNSMSRDPQIKALGQAQMQRAQVLMSLDTYQRLPDGGQINLRTGKIEYPPTPRMATDASGNLIAVNPGGGTAVVSPGGANPGVNADANATRVLQSYPPNSPEYRDAYAHLYGERTEMGPSGPVTYRPRTPPAGLASPTFGTQPQAGAAPPASGGAGVTYAAPVQPNAPLAAKIGVPLADSNPYEGMAAAEQQKLKAENVRAVRERFAKRDETDAKMDEMITGLQRFKELNAKAFTGPAYGAPIIGGVLRTGARFDPAFQEMEAITSGIAPNMRVAGSGSSSDTDVAMFKNATVGIDKPVEVNRNIADAYILAAQNRKDSQAFTQAFVEANGHEQGADRMWDKYLKANPIFDPEKKDTYGLNTKRVPWQDWFRNAIDPQTGRMKDMGAPGVPFYDKNGNLVNGR